MLAQPRVPGFEKRKQLVTDAIAGKSEMAIGRVFAPGLVQRAEIDFDVTARRGKEGAQDAAFRKFEDGMDAGETLGPRAAEELGENGFSLVVEGVRGGNGIDQPCVGRSFGQDLSEPLIA